MTIGLQSYAPQEPPFAVDITAAIVFSWHRWLRNVVSDRELIHRGIVRVFALCQTTNLEAQIVFCHPDDAYTRAKPVKRLEYERLNGWRDCPIFSQAPVATASWMQTRAHQLVNNVFSTWLAVATPENVRSPTTGNAARPVNVMRSAFSQC